MKQRNLRTIFAFLFAWVLLGESPATAQYSKRDRSVAQVLFNTVYMDPHAGVPDDATVREYLSAFADDTGNTYGTTQTVRPRGAPPYRWSLKVAYLPEGWQPDREKEKEWNVLHGNGPIRMYHKPDRILIRYRDDGLQLSLLDLRKGGLSAETHLRKALPRWDMFLSEAKRYKLFDEEVELIVQLDDTSWYGAERVEDKDVRSVDDDVRKPADFSITTWVEVGGERPTEPVRILVELADDPESQREAQIRASGSERVGNAHAFRIDEDNGSESLTVRFRAIPEDEKLLGQAATIVFWIEGKKDETRKRITLHRTTWVPVLYQFEVYQSRERRDTRRPMSGAPGRPAIPDGADRHRRHEQLFNHQRIRAASEAEAWLELSDLVAIRPCLDEGFDAARRWWRGPDDPVFQEEEPVMQGFFIDDVSGSSYFTAENSLESPNTLANWQEQADFEVRYGLTLARDLRPLPPSDGESDDELGFEDPDSDLGWDDDALLEELLQGEIGMIEHRRAELKVEEFEVSIVEVTRQGIGIPERAKDEKTDSPERRTAIDELARQIRLPAGYNRDNGGRPFKRILAEKKPGLEDTIDAYWALPFDQTHGIPIRLKHDGIYEVRFHLKLRDTKGAQEAKTLQAAIRINVLPVGFHVIVLDWQTRQLKD